MKQHELDELKKELKPFWRISPKRHFANPKARQRKKELECRWRMVSPHPKK